MAITTRPHWSYSQLSQYLRCPLQYYFERVAKLPRGPVPVSLILGSAVHYALAEHHEKLKHKRTLSESQRHIAFLEEWNRRTSNDDVDFGSKESSALIEQGKSLIDLWCQEELPGEIVAVEQPFLVPIPCGSGEYLERPLVAIADLIVKVDGRLRLIEFKTSQRSYSRADVDESLQATCYVHAAQEMFGETASVEYAVLVKTKTPKLQRLTTERSEQDVRRLGETIRLIDEAIQAGQFYPNPSPRNCSTCSYRGPCAAWPASTETVQLDTAFLDTAFKER